ncbi:hypothetical protein [Chromohalobacter israelensis]|uniref:hypothetical protein n=1 Tax=Chromohalobacter israelensis TaxID=141390 RepID=UPI00265C20A7|nr:hypothetical protein [Chromohalobacter salexigens]MDO0944617.1 hypothetical protein [Chromohalobacter salexigens]
MRGKVIGINHNRGLIAIQVDEGDITVAEMLGGYSVELGDVIRGDLETVAGETFYNITKSEEMEVFVEGWGCDLHGAKMMMR